MVEAEPITDPSLLQELNIELLLSSLSIETSEPQSESVSQTRQARLALLQPLANADVLDACRDPASRYLNIQPLSKAWRQALAKVPPFPQLTFDLTLPKEDNRSNGSFQKVHWDISMPKEAGLGIVARDVMTLVTTIATGTRMRVDGDVRFEVTYEETDGVSLRAMTRLKQQLLVLAGTKVLRVKEAGPCA
jgi:hypothetical protein